MRSAASAYTASVMTSDLAAEFHLAHDLLTARIETLCEKYRTASKRRARDRDWLSSAITRRAKLRNALVVRDQYSKAQWERDYPLDEAFRRFLRELLNEDDEGDTDPTGLLTAWEWGWRPDLAALVGCPPSCCRELWRAVLHFSIGVRSSDELAEEIGKLLPGFEEPGLSILFTLDSICSRHSDLRLDSGATDQLYLYVGPLDSVTRPFCRKQSGHVLQRDEVEALNNGQLPNPLLTGGGYECRHSWKRVSTFDQEIMDLHKTGERAPWVKDRSQATPNETVRPTAAPPAPPQR
jgi:hypothetical protein